jgi:hypothetical protein
MMFLFLLLVFIAAIGLILFGLIMIAYRYESSKIIMEEYRHNDILRQINNINLDIADIKRSINSRGKNI